jgi:DNA-binding transcriptional MerR regulator
MRIVCGQRAYRYFTRKQVEQIQAIKKLLDEGFTLSHASRLARKSSGKEGS